MATHRRVVKETDKDFYRTPAWGTKALLHYERFEGSITEPCCGIGDISKVLKKSGYEVKSSDLINRGYGKEKDIFKLKQADNIITNPPFNIANDIIDHSLSITKHKVCMLLRLAYLEGIQRYHTIFTHRPPNRIRVFSERLSMYPGDSDRTTGGTTAFAWFIWTPIEVENPTVHWISPRFKSGYGRFYFAKSTALLF